MWNFSELTSLASMCHSIHAFSDDKNDEFTIVRENGQTQGIFKSWAVPVIPFLDFGEIKILSDLWPEILLLATKMDFWQALKELTSDPRIEIQKKARRSLEIIEIWKSECNNNPTSLQRSLERARLYSWMIDIQLTRIFDEEKLADSPSIKINQLFNRLVLAFGLMNPFYHLEVLAGDQQWICGQDNKFNGLSGSGRLDAIAILLPAAFRDFVIADKLDWHQLNWNKIRELTHDALENMEVEKILLNIAKISGLPPHQVIFAANVMQWIPARVAGKKEDPINTVDALMQIEEILAEPESSTTVLSVLAEMNSLIRFLNWVPLTESDDNFEGINWTYSSVCDTTNLLLATVITNPEVWKDDFREIFEQTLKGQLNYLDASSAKGRCLISLIQEGHIKEEFTPEIDHAWQHKILEIVSDPLSFSRVYDYSNKLLPKSLIGDKPYNLILAKMSLGEKNVPQGLVISSSEVKLFLDQNENLWREIINLHLEHSIVVKQKMAQNIEMKVNALSIPNWLNRAISKRLLDFDGVDSWAIRSSSLEEGEARGIYDSLLDVSTGKISKAVIACIASFFKNDAVLFRSTSRSGDIPNFAVFILPFYHGRGGVASKTTKDGKCKTLIETGTSPAEITSNGSVAGGVSQTICEYDHHQNEVLTILDTLENKFGPIQIEWVETKDEIKLLQMDFITSEHHSVQLEHKPDFSLTLNSLEDIEIIKESLNRNDGLVSLTLGESVELVAFQPLLFTLINLFGRRIIEIKTPKMVTKTSHFANIFRHFGIKLICL